jgi:membrane protein implicated in regulation of membrane protease activity
MLVQTIADIGGWNWILLGCILLVLEILSPGVYLLWIGIAGILTGTITLQVAGWAAWTWQVQVLVFLALSLISAYAGSRIMKNRRDQSDEPLLNQRAAQLIGRTATLEQPISEGVGRVRIGDTLWRVEGPDLPAGARVRVSGTDGSALRVEEA